MVMKPWSCGRKHFQEKSVAEDAEGEDMACTEVYLEKYKNKRVVSEGERKYITGSMQEDH